MLNIIIEEFCMKKKSFLVWAGIILALVSALVFTGCPKEPEDNAEFDSRLVNSWTNDPAHLYKAEDGTIGLKKTFKINEDHTFTASINPTYIKVYNGGYKKEYDRVKATGGTDEAAKATGETAGKQALMGLSTQVTDESTRWTVTGKLDIDDKEIYIMKDLHETSDPPKPADFTKPAEGGSADQVVSAFGGPLGRVKIHFTGEKTFSFRSAINDNPENQVTLFFGGDYSAAE
jgi:hypothetical protein